MRRLILHVVAGPNPYRRRRFEPPPHCRTDRGRLVNRQSTQSGLYSGEPSGRSTTSRPATANRQMRDSDTPGLARRRIALPPNASTMARPSSLAQATRVSTFTSAMRLRSTPSKESPVTPSYATTTPAAHCATSPGLCHEQQWCAVVRSGYTSIRRKILGDGVVAMWRRTRTRSRRRAARRAVGDDCSC